MWKIKKYAMTTIAKKKIPIYVDWEAYSIEEWIDIINFYKKFWELPFNDFDWKLTEDIIYDFYVEKYRKFKPSFNEFFTPNRLAEKVVEVFDEYFDFQNHTRTLDAFCWTWQLMKYFNDDAFIEGFDFNDNFLEINKYFWRKVFKHNTFSVWGKKVNDLDKTHEIECIISNPPFWKYCWTVIDKYIIDFFYNNLKDWWIVICILPCNFLSKYAKYIEGKFIVRDTIEHDVQFDYVKINTSIFVLQK